MKTENGKIEGDFEVEESFALYGMVTGNITVKRAGSLQLYGICEGDLIVEGEGTAVIDGTVGGSLLNSGTVELRGVINGNVLSYKGLFQKSPNAVIRGSTQPLTLRTAR